MCEHCLNPSEEMFLDDATLRRLIKSCEIAKAALNRNEFERTQRRLRAAARLRLEQRARRHFDNLWRKLERRIKTEGLTADIVDRAIDWDNVQVELGFGIQGELYDLVRLSGMATDRIMGQAGDGLGTGGQRVLHVRCPGTYSGALRIRVYSRSISAAGDSMNIDPYGSWEGYFARGIDSVRIVSSINANAIVTVCN